MKVAALVFGLGMMVAPFVQASQVVSARKTVGDCSVSCTNPEYCCPGGYFCVRNELCLRGSPGDYEAAAFVGVGVLLGVISSVEGFSLSTSCVDDVFASVDVALASFHDWDSGNHGAAMGDLRSLFSDLSKTWSACKQQQSEPWWEKALDVAAKIAEDFFPEVKAIDETYEIIVHGYNLYGDYKRIKSSCFDAAAANTALEQSYGDWVNCGIGIGDFGYQVYELLKDAEANPSATFVFYSDAVCGTEQKSLQIDSACYPVGACNVPSCSTATQCLESSNSVQAMLTCLGCTGAAQASIQLNANAANVSADVFNDVTCSGPSLPAWTTEYNKCLPTQCGSSFMLKN